MVVDIVAAHRRQGTWLPDLAPRPLWAAVVHRAASRNAPGRLATLAAVAA